MFSQILTKPAAVRSFYFCLAPVYPLPSQPILASSLDYGFDFDEQELGMELLAPLPDGLGDQTSHPIGAEEFDSLYQWFNS